MAALTCNAQAGACHNNAGKLSAAPQRPLVSRVAHSARPRVVSVPVSKSTAFTTDSWPMNWRIPSLEDVGKYYQEHVLKNKSQEGSKLDEVMSRQIICVTENIALAALSNTFKKVSGVCVVDEEKRLIGVLSRKDLTREGSTVREVMSTPPVACKADATVRDAAALMLKHKVHRIPIVDSDARVVGMVTRTDIFTALEQGK